MAPDCIFNITGLVDNTFHGFFITNFITIVFLILCSAPFHVQLVTVCDKLHKLYFSNYFTSVFKKIHCVLLTVIRLYWVASQCRQLYAPKQKSKRNKQGLSQRLIQTVPPMDDCIPGPQTRLILVYTEPSPSPLLAPLTPQTPALQQDSVTDISDVLGTHVFQGYVETPLKTLDGIVVNQPKRVLPLAEEAKRLAKEIRIKKLNEQWASIPCKQLLNQSFTDQLNSIQILEQLVPLELAKQHLPVDIIDILEHLGKADNIPFNQLYYIAENCADQYYTKVIETFVSIIKRQFADCQLLLVNTAHCLKFLEEYSDCQSQIWKIFHKHHTIPEDLQDLHFHFDDFKNSLEKDFKFLKEATS